MRAIKVTLQQPSASFRKPTSRSYQETYPLPPYSTVVGFIHAIAGFTEYHPMKVSIQGSFQSKTLDLQTQHFLTNEKSEKPNKTLFYDNNNNVIGGVLQGIASVETLINLCTIIHLVPEIDDDFTHIYNALHQPKMFPALGRYDDLVNIQSIEEVLLVEKELDEDEQNQFAAYIPVQLIDDIVSTTQTGTFSLSKTGTYFDLPKKYEINPKTNQREWAESHPVVYTSNFTIFADEELLIDPDGLPVFLA